MPMVGLSEDMSCNVTITSGTYMVVMADYGDGNTDSFYVAGELCVSCVMHNNYLLTNTN